MTRSIIIEFGVVAKLFSLKLFLLNFGLNKLKVNSTAAEITVWKIFSVNYVKNSVLHVKLFLELFYARTHASDKKFNYFPIA